MKIVDRLAAQTAEALGEDILPSDKKAVVTLVELRTKLEIRSIALRASVSLNVALLAGVIAKILIGK